MNLTHHVRLMAAYNGWLNAKLYEAAGTLSCRGAAAGKKCVLWLHHRHLESHCCRGYDLAEANCVPPGTLQRIGADTRIAPTHFARSGSVQRIGRTFAAQEDARCRHFELGERVDGCRSKSKLAVREYEGRCVEQTLLQLGNAFFQSPNASPGPSRGLAHASWCRHWRHGSAGFDSE